MNGRSSRHPLAIEADQPVDGFDEYRFRQLGEREAAGGSLEAGGVLVSAEDRDPTTLLPECLETFEDGLRIVKDGDRWIQLQGRIRNKLGFMPAAFAVPADPNHVLGEDAAESRIRKQLRPGLG
jgi:hypothetical protein